MATARRAPRGPRLGALALFALWLPLAVVAAAQAPLVAAVASAHPAATRAGLQVIAAGGNAFDAAVAVTAALGVVEPYASGLGGGGFWLLHDARRSRTVMLDARERAPLQAHRDLYLNAAGEVRPLSSIDGPLAAGIPGVPAALGHLAANYGRLALGDSLAPAIALAREGFPADEVYRRLAGLRLAALRRWPEAARIFLLDGGVPPAGHLIRQPALAATLSAIARDGADGFYRGAIADQLVEGSRQAGGIWTHADLQAYAVIEREPIRFRYRGMRVESAAPPSSGGVALATMMNLLAGYDLAATAPARATHLMVEAMRRAYRDRAEYLGDPDFVSVPLAMLTDPHYAAGLRAGIRPDRATASASLPGVGPGAGGADTSHFAIIDRAGNRISATLSINYPFGSGFVVPGTGVLLNDEMDDFAAKPGVANAYGLVGAQANAIEPGKRMLSSMTPSFLETEHRVALLGTPGGSRIITAVLLAALSFEQGGDAGVLVGSPRFHHQFLPDRIELEPGRFSEDLVLELQWLGHEVQVREHSWGNMQAVVWDKRDGRVEAASDPRGIGSAELLQAAER